MTFQPRVALGLAFGPLATAMIDVSDGLSRDLGHICAQSRVGAVLEADAIPIHDDALELFRQDHVSPLEHALHDGEDHELLFTSAAPGLESETCRRIGTITDEPGRGILLRHKDGTLTPVAARGWEHRLG
jgi:thiamine-monophosphate kinase